MPNWCYNQVTIKGNKESIDAVQELLKSDKSMFDFEKIRPTPIELLDNTAPNFSIELAEGFKVKFGHPDWYEWRCANWGTKWNTAVEDNGRDFIRSQEEDTHILYYNFDTAWSPPEPILRAISRIFRNIELTIEFHEEANEYSSMIVKYEDGEVTEQTVIKNKFKNENDNA